MATTPNNGWVTPDNTSFVKDGALAQRTTANSIDASVGTGLLAWSTWTPVVTATVGVITTVVINTARFSRIGKTVHLVLNYTVTNNGTGSGLQSFTLPVTAQAAGQGTGAGIRGSDGNAMSCFMVSLTAVQVAMFNFTYPGAVNVRVALTYESA